MPPTIYWRHHHGEPTRDDRWVRYGHCARCGEELLRVILAPDPDIRARHGWHWLTPLCGQCATPEEAAYAHASADCPGCGIPLSFNPRDAMGTRMVCLLGPVLPARVAAVATDQDADLHGVPNGLPCRQHQHRLRLATRPAPLLIGHDDKAAT